MSQLREAYKGIVRELRKAAIVSERGSAKSSLLLHAAADSIELLLDENETMPDVNEFERGQWDMFVTITSAWYGKQYYFMQDNGIVYSRLSHNYMSVDDAYKEFIDAISEY